MPKKVLKSNSKLPVIRACRFLRFYKVASLAIRVNYEEKGEKKITEKVKPVQRFRADFWAC